MNREERRRAQREGRYEGAQPARGGGQAYTFAIGEAARPENRDLDLPYRTWILNHLGDLGEQAVTLHMAIGRCALVLRFGPDGLPAGPAEPITIEALRHSSTRASAELLGDAMRSYDPQCEIVVAAVERATSGTGKETTWVYKLRAEPDAAA